MHASNKRPTLPPAERIALSVLSLVVLVLLWSWLAGRPVLDALIAHAVLLVLAAIGARLLGRGVGGKRRPVLRGLGVMGVMFTLYYTLGQIAFTAMPYQADAAVAAFDAALFGGTAPVLWAEGFVTPLRTEALSLVYAFFIPYLYLSIMMGLFGRPDLEREDFVTGVTFVYGLGFLGYLFLPAKGPIVHQAADFAASLPSGPFLSLVERGIEAAGGPHGAMPSLHVAITSYLCGFDLRHNRLRGLTYLPFVVLIAISTVYLRYHYAVDVVAGLLLAGLALYIVPRWTRRFRARQP